MTEPTVEPEKRTGGKRRRGGGRRRVWAQRILAVLAAIMLAPVLLTLLYMVPVVRPVSTLMIKDLATLRGYDRQWVALEDVAPVLIHSVIMSEDGQFCSHRGVDLRELAAVMENALAGGARRGASTITMQTVKNLYLWQQPLAAARKVIEIPLALYVDLVMPKRRIMEIYLNIAELGPGIYGVEAAARHHFRKSSKELTRREAALLTAALPNPIVRDPAKPSPGMRRIAGIIERRARSAGAYVGCVTDG